MQGLRADHRSWNRQSALAGSLQRGQPNLQSGGHALAADEVAAAVVEQPPLGNGGTTGERRLFDNRGRDFIRRESVAAALQIGLAALDTAG